MLDISTLVFVFSIVVVGVLLTVTIRRDFMARKRLRREHLRKVERIQARRRSAERH